MKNTEMKNDDARNLLEKKTGEVFENLWPAYNDKLFEESVELFFKRINDWGFGKDFFKGKVCLDAGCGGGRNSIAMAKLGAQQVHGIDLGKQGIIDARKRSQGMKNVSFNYGSVLDIEFKENMFDYVWFAGVLMITADPAKALSEIKRVLKPGGELYLLVYANGGMRWPLIEILRKLAWDIGEKTIDEAISLAGLAANKRRTFLDDLFCPVLDFYSWERLEMLLEAQGYTNIRRMPRDLYDHEASLEKFREDIESLTSLFAAGVENKLSSSNCFANGLAFCKCLIDTIRSAEAEVASGAIPEEQAMNRIIGQGHHRVWATKSA